MRQPFEKKCSCMNEILTKLTKTTAEAEAELVDSMPDLTDPSASSSSSLQLPEIMILARNPDSIFSGDAMSFLTGSQTVKFSYGYSSFEGKSASMEYFYETRISEVDGQMVAFLGVYDGHGGSRTAEYLKNNLFRNLSSHPDSVKDTKTAIVEDFRQTDEAYLNEEKGKQKDAGSISTAVLLGDGLLVANVGDSRVVASRAGLGTWRVIGGVLAVYRAFGDKLLKPYIVAEPEIQDAVAMVQDITDAEAVSRKLIHEAFARRSSTGLRTYDQTSCLRHFKYFHEWLTLSCRFYRSLNGS